MRREEVPFSGGTTNCARSARLRPTAYRLTRPSDFAAFKTNHLYYPSAVLLLTSPTPTPTIMTMRAPLESFAQFNEHAQRHFPTEFSNLPHSSTTRDANVKCDCCCLKVHGVFIGQAFERTTARDWQDGKQSIRMLATVVGDDVQVYLVKDKGMLCDHVSYYLDEAAQFASGYFRPFNLVTGNARYYDLEPIIRYYLWAKGNTAAVDGQDTKFDASFRSACRRIGEMQGHQGKVNSP